MQAVRFLKKFVRDDEGVTAIEYGLIAALIALRSSSAHTAVGVALDGLFTRSLRR